MSNDLDARVAAALDAPVDPAVRAFATRLGATRLGAAGQARAVLFYGSNLRTGSLDGVLDFYLLLPGEVERGIWPRVSYHEWPHDGVVLRAKVATMTLATFRRAAEGTLLDTTIWARFVQPSALAWCASDRDRHAVAGALAAAAITAARLAVALGPARGSATEYWRALFRATYRAEFRVEKAGREDSILAANSGHFDGLLPAALDGAGIGFGLAGEAIEPALPPAERRRILRWWRRRQRLGKPYNLLRLLKASTTFEGAARYAAWKLERHTGVPVPLSAWQERHPVLAAPGVLWRVWRRRAAA